MVEHQRRVSKEKSEGDDGSIPYSRTMENKKISKPKRLSPKEKGFIKDIAKGKSGTDAILNNYDTTDRKVAGVMAAENLAKPRIMTALKDAFPDELLEATHKELLRAGTLDQMTFPLEKRSSLFDSDDDQESKLFFKEAVKIAIESGKVSTSELQRKLKIGYANASRLMDRLKEKMIIDAKNVVIPGREVTDEIEEDEESEEEEQEDDANINQGEVLTDLDIIELLASVGCVVKKIVKMYGLRHVYFWSPDNMARDKALDKAYKIKGSYAAEKLNLSGANGEPLFTDEHRAKSKRAIASYLAGRNTRTGK